MYKVYDWYEGCQLVGEFEDWHEMMKFKKRIHNGHRWGV